ncbi:hypothetical protein LguiB_035825 [Lonicera macranthoides]
MGTNVIPILLSNALNFCHSSSLKPALPLLSEAKLGTGSGVVQSPETELIKSFWCSTIK